MNRECEHVSDLLADYDAGNLSRRRARRVERHLASCSRCRDQLAGLRRAAESVVAAGLEEPPPGVWSAVSEHVASHPRQRAAARPRLRLRPALATLALIIVALGIWWAVRVTRPPTIEIVSADVEAASYLRTHAAAAWGEPLADPAILGATLVRPVADAEEGP